MTTIVFDEKQFLQSGTSRSSYSFDETWIVKVPINDVGILQNQTEAEIYEQFKDTPYGIFLAPCRIDKSTNLLYMKKVAPLPRLTKETIAEYIAANHPNVRHHDPELIRRFVQLARLHEDDIYTSDAWGIDGDKTVIFDYGCTVDIFAMYYRW